MKVIYFASGDVSVLESQVLELLHFLTLEGIDVTLLQGVSGETEKKAIQKKIASYPSLQVIWLKRYPLFPFFFKKHTRSILHALQSVNGWEKAIIHVRGEYSGYLMKKIIHRYHISNPVLIDIRGVICEELRYKIEHSPTHKFLNIIQYKYFKRTYRYLFDSKFQNQIAISSVSAPINDYFKKNYPECAYRFTVHPNIAGEIMKYSEEKRRVIRKELGLDESDVVVLCATGGGSVWQKDKEIIMPLLNAGFKVINLSKTSVNLKGCISTFVPFKKMPDIMAAADAGMLWRKKSFINYSASPSKLSEFAALGLFILHNNTVQTAINYIQQTHAGRLLQNTADITPDLLHLIQSQNRKLNCCKGQEVFSVNNIGASYIRLYHSLE